MKKNYNYPIILGQGFRKGICATKNKSGSRDVDILFVRLKRDIESGAEFNLDDIESIEVDLRFVDRQTVKRTVDILQAVLDYWREDKEEHHES